RAKLEHPHARCDRLKPPGELHAVDLETSAPAAVPPCCRRQRHARRATRHYRAALRNRDRVRTGYKRLVEMAEVRGVTGRELQTREEGGNLDADSALDAAASAARRAEIEIGFERPPAGGGGGARIEGDRCRPPRLTRPASPERGAGRRRDLERDSHTVAAAHGR